MSRPIMHQDVGLWVSGFIAYDAHVPGGWIAMSSMYDIVWDKFLIRIEVLGVQQTFKIYREETAHKIYNAAVDELREFVMLLWGEPQWVGAAP